MAEIDDDDTDCIFCGGFGNVKGERCFACHGSGLDSDADRNLDWMDEEEDENELEEEF